MKKYRFPLQSVQTVRAIGELHAKEGFSKAVRAAAEAQRALDAVQERLTSLENLLLNERGTVMRPAEHVAHLLEHERLREEVKKAADAFAKARQKMDAAREVWITARKGLKVIENLEKKNRHQYNLDFEREAQALLDDRTNAMVGRAPLLLP